MEDYEDFTMNQKSNQLNAVKSCTYMMYQWLHLLFAIFTGQIGYAIHHNLAWSVIDAIFFPLAWIKWIFYHEVTLNIIKHSFDWFYL
jgi:membrane protein YdbS with pleckstrin-like domain